MRLALNMTQSELSRRSGVSQSTIAKIERGNIRGSYDSVARIFQIIYDEMDRKKRGKKVKQVASMNPVMIQKGERLRRASELMREGGFSQLPVFDGKAHVGSVSEKDILRLLREGKRMSELAKEPVEKLMEDVFPIVSEDTPLEVVTVLLSHSGAVLVSDGGGIIGIVTSSDLLKLI